MRKKERVIRGIKISILLLLLFCIFLLVMNRNAVLGFATDSINSISSKFYVSFDRFLGDVPVTEEEVEEPIEGINLEEDDTFTYQDIAAYQAGISDLFAIIGDKDYYYDHFSDVQDYYEGIQTKLSGDYLEDILNERKDSNFTTIFENIYKNQNCSLYEVDSAFFQKGKTGWKPEWISEQPVIVLNETKIDNLYEELQKAQSQNQLIIHKFLEQNSYKNMIAQHIIDRLIRFDLLEKAEQDPRFQKQFRKLFEQLKILLSGEYL